MSSIPEKSLGNFGDFQWHCFLFCFSNHFSLVSSLSTNTESKLEEIRGLFGNLGPNGGLGGLFGGLGGLGGLGQGGSNPFGGLGSLLGGGGGNLEGLLFSGFYVS